MPIPFAAIASLAQGLLGMGAAKTQNSLNAMSIQEQRRSAMEQERLAKATRRDAQGNETRYSDSEGFITTAAPLIKAILDAQSKEQYTSLREDAPRAREASVRKDNRSRSADEEYGKAFSQRANRPEKSEGEFQADALFAAASGRGSKVPAGLYSTAIRSGDPSALRRVAAAGNQQEGTLAQAIAAARQGGSAQYLADRSARDQVDFGELGQLRGIANDTDASNTAYNNSNEQLAGQQSNAIQTLMQAISGGAGGVSNALRSAAGSLQTPDIGSIIKSIGGIVDPEDPNAGKDVELEKLIRSLQMSDANLKLKKNAREMSLF